MLRNIFLFFLLLMTTLSAAQTLFQRGAYDHRWILGSFSTSDPTAANINMDFNHTPYGLNSALFGYRFDFTNASMCNEEGDLLFYTNGITINNRTHNLMENGERINPGDYTDDWVELGNPIVQGALILPQPSSDSIYHLLYAEIERVTIDEVPTIRIMRLHHGYINTAANSGVGTVVEKDFPLIADTLDAGKITACRHGNGRDWWIVIPYANANNLHRYLLDNTGLHDHGIVTAGEGMHEGFGQAVFSPRGDKYINYSLHYFEENYLGIYDFDRCTGELVENVVIFNDLYIPAAGVAVSENGRFAYESSYTEVFQLDLESDDIAASRTQIADYDGFHEPEHTSLWTTFFLAQLTPNGRIFVNSPTSVRHLHQIAHPNRRGTAADFRQHDIELPAWNQLTMPNFPYYGLGPWDGSPCDTLGINNPSPEARFEYTQDTSALELEFFDASHYAAAWSWDFGDGSPMDTSQFPIHTFSEAGSYEVCLSVSNITGSDTYCETFYVGTVGTQQVFFPGIEARLWPNPWAGEPLHLSMDGVPENHGPLKFILHDAFGRTLYQQSLLMTGPKLEVILSIPALAAGLYYYEVLEGNRILVTGKISKL